MHFELYRARRGLFVRTQWRWRLRAANGHVIADSGEGYNNRGDALAAIVLVQGSSKAHVVGGGVL